MKKIFKIVIYLFVIGVIAGGGVYLYVFHKPHRNLANEKPTFEYTAEKLYSEFSKDEVAGNKKFGNKAIEVSGTVVEKTITPNSITFVLNDAMSGVSCSFDSAYVTDNKEELTKVENGKALTVRGQCDGFDMILGVVLTSCVLTEKK